MSSRRYIEEPSERGGGGTDRDARPIPLRDRAWVETRVATSGLSIVQLNGVDIERKYFSASFLYPRETRDNIATATLLRLLF